MEHRDIRPSAVEIDELTVTLPIPGGTLTAVRDLSLTLAAGEMLGIVGESGSGKSMTALALMGLLPQGADWTARRITLGETDLRALSERQMSAQIRGKRIGMIFQEPMTSLNPVYPIGRQLIETMTLHGGSRAAARDRALELLHAVGLPEPEERFNQYPHQFSGGQRQRIMIAMALMNAPDILIADEPTTALDVTIQAQILDLLRDLRERLGIAMILITHDFGVVANHVDRVMVMLKGEVVEDGPVEAVLRNPRHDYTKRLLASIPGAAPQRAPTGDTPALIEVAHVSRTYSFRRGIFGPRREVQAVRDASLVLKQGETLAIVGESGSGKSTLARLILGLEARDRGQIRIDGTDVADIPPMARARLAQPVFQDPYGSLNPRASVSEIIRRPLDVHQVGTRAERDAKVRRVMEQTGLGPRFYHAFPNQMSGGQRQRVAIARALILDPRIVICDEPTSALDVSIQAQILTLLDRLKVDLGLTLLMITHDLGVVRQMADRVVVMRQGEIVERGETTAFFNAPETDYARQLLRAVPAF
ncbi:ABC transporter ATP-binding protein [Thalassococcus sp. S3]|uniref:ABC transporter ATP-binding protein n=1 Tax=Thalassococcus sp. S3 TaxID=2017482 RepID=UPI00102438FD|nr:ABC transporter ATP-binding protein [Thalassococcus sp. S3]QBF30533.1 microcin ABC transporter ATP-binding protein [Thalassococcus sp. S3]